MKKCISDYIRYLVAMLPEAETVREYRPLPKIKPPRRRPSIKNKTDQAHYMRDYMRQYREQGKGYQKMPEYLKKWRREHLKKPQNPNKEN